MKIVNQKKGGKNNSLSILIVLILKVLGVSLLFGITFFLTNNFEASLVGKYDFTRSVLLIVGGLTVLGMNQSIVYYGGYLKAKNELNNLRLVYFKMLSIILVFSVLLAVLYSIIPNQVIDLLIADQETTRLLFKVVLSLGFFAVMMLNFDTLRSLGQIKTSEVFKNIIRYIPFGLGAIYIYSVNLSFYLVEVFLLNFVFLAIVSSVYVIFQLQKLEAPNQALSISRKAIIKRSYPMAISFIAYILLQSTDIIILSRLKGFELTAYYAVAVKIATGLSLVLLAVNTVIAPQIAQFYEEQKLARINQIISKSTRLIFLLTLPVVIVLVFFGTYVLGLFGENYSQSYWALNILLFGQIVNAFFGPVGTYMNMTGKQNTQQLILISAVLINIVLNFMLIPIYGMEGAAFATATTTVLWNIAASSYVYRKEKVKTFLN